MATKKLLVKGSEKKAVETVATPVPPKGAGSVAAAVAKVEPPKVPTPPPAAVVPPPPVPTRNPWCVPADKLVAAMTVYVIGKSRIASATFQSAKGDYLTLRADGREFHSDRGLVFQTVEGAQKALAVARTLVQSPPEGVDMAVGSKIAGYHVGSSDWEPRLYPLVISGAGISPETIEVTDQWGGVDRTMPRANVRPLWMCQDGLFQRVSSAWILSLWEMARAQEMESGKVSDSDPRALAQWYIGKGDVAEATKLLTVSTMVPTPPEYASAVPTVAPTPVVEAAAVPATVGTATVATTVETANTLNKVLEILRTSGQRDFAAQIVERSRTTTPKALRLWIINESRSFKDKGLRALVLTALK